MNWSFISGVGIACSSALAALAAIPYQLGDAAVIIPPEWKAKLTIAGICSAFVLRNYTRSM